MTQGPRYEKTGVPLVDAVARALMDAFDEGAAYQRGNHGEYLAAHEKTLTAIAEIQRLWKQLDVELGAARGPKATGTPPVAIPTQGTPESRDG